MTNTTEQRTESVRVDPHWDQTKLKSHVATTLYISTLFLSCDSPLPLPVPTSPLLSWILSCQCLPCFSQTLLPSAPSKRVIQYVSWIPWTSVSPQGCGHVNRTRRIRADRLNKSSPLRQSICSSCQWSLMCKVGLGVVFNPPQWVQSANNQPWVPKILTWTCGTGGLLVICRTALLCLCHLNSPGCNHTKCIIQGTLSPKLVFWHWVL